MYFNCHMLLGSALDEERHKIIILPRGQKNSIWVRAHSLDVGNPSWDPSTPYSAQHSRRYPQETHPKNNSVRGGRSGLGNPQHPELARVGPRITSRELKGPLKAAWKVRGSPQKKLQCPQPGISVFSFMYFPNHYQRKISTLQIPPWWRKDTIHIQNHLRWNPLRFKVKDLSQLIIKFPPR